MDANAILEEIVNRFTKNEEQRERRNFFIYRIPAHIRERCKDYYEPRVVSIGPYHHGSPHLQAMEELKRRYLAEFLSRSGILLDYITALMRVEPLVRRCYFENVGLSEVEFVKMLLLDGCFIIELLIKSYDDEQHHGTIRASGEINNSVLPEWMKGHVKTDLLMLENQIPFAVLKGLYDIYQLQQAEVDPPDHDAAVSGGEPRRSPSLAQLIVHFLLDGRSQSGPALGEDQIYHLLHLYHHCFVPRRTSDLVHPLEHIEENRIHQIICVEHFGCNITSYEPARTPFQVAKYIIRPWVFTIIAHFTEVILFGSFIQLHATSSRMMIRCATELKDFGVKIEGDTSERSFLDVTFSFDGILRIPHNVIDESTRSNYMNLVAFEQCSSKVEKELTSYAVFMNCVIRKPQDVAILQGKKIIENKLPNEEEIVRFFNDLRACAYNYQSEYFKVLFEDLNRYCDAPYPTARARLVHNFRSRRWTIISGLIVLVLLGCGVYQAIISSLDYFYPYRN